jgi:hypothetical protein
MAKKPTPTDAQLILQLYDLRREAELRKARNWWLTEFWPQSVEDITKIVWAMGTQENNWMRQGGGYWSMAASLVLSGTLNAELFLQPTNSGEMYLFFAKIHPFLKDLREKLEDPMLFGNIEQVINSTKFSRERLKFTLKRVQTLREKRAGAKAS